MIAATKIFGQLQVTAAAAGTHVDVILHLAAQAGVYLHGAAADALSKSKGPFGYLATDVVNALPEAIKTLSDSV